ncbi:septum site-determining protein MinC [Psychrobacter sp. DM4]|uniref:septum site-determining protein MinC n=1 Tax=Psychrobacter sp. DM4 TaxID=3440637 RepID=UPI003F503CCF
MTISDIGNPLTTDSDTSAIAFFGKMLTFSRLQLNSNDLNTIDAQLSNTIDNKNTNTPVIIDSEIEQDLPALIDLLWSWGLQPIGVLKGVLEPQARIQKLAIFPADGKRIERIIPSKKTVVQVSENAIEPKETTKGISATTEAHTTNQVSQTQTTLSTDAPHTLLSDVHITSLIYDQVLRSGQSLNHVGGDLILTNSVNSGAEAITDNNLHVYARAQGRLVAGATGDQDARIFCQVFNPSLVSVAGTYCLRDNLPEHLIDKPVQVRFVDGQGLVFTMMDTV